MAELRAAATESLIAHTRGEPRGATELLPLVYDQLRALAASYMRGERSGHTLQATALVHEAYVRLIDLDRIDWRGKTHFFAMAARSMRRVLVDHARAGAAQKRGGGAQRVTFLEDRALAAEKPIELIALDQALDRLAKRSERQARVVELRLFAGLGVRETAHALDVSERTVKSDWRVARSWLLRELGETREASE